MVVPAPDDQLLADYCFAADPAPGPRLSLFIPDLAPKGVFGGVATGLDLYFAAARRMAGSSAPELRLITTSAPSAEKAAIVARCAARHGLDGSDVEYRHLGGPNAELPLRSRDVVMTYNWATTLNMAPLLEAQSAHFGRAPLPLLYLIQEYEPHLLPFSSAQMLAREAYERPRRLWGVFNSASLHDYCTLMGHSPERAFVFEPVMAAALRRFLPQGSTSARSRRLIAYGRPGHDRNCFPALVRGLRRWAAEHPEFSDWEVFSAGTRHRSVPLGDGRAMKSLGKLPIEDYARLMLESAAGIALMASPHPSYPPLEMVHFGLRTVTNRFLRKDWAGAHPNLIAVDSIDSATLSEALAEACRRALEPPPTTAPGSPFLRDDDYPFLPELIEALSAELG